MAGSQAHGVGGSVPMTIKEIAKLASVSTATVSRVVNGAPGVRMEIRAQVEKIILQTNYWPNLMARGLVKKKTNIFGLMMPRFDGYYSKRVEAILNVCSRHKYGVMISSGLENYEEELENLNLLAKQRVEGIIYSAGQISQRQKNLIAQISERIPMVLLDQSSDELNIPCILQDNYSGAQKAMRFIMACGHSRIAFIAPPRNDGEAEKRTMAYFDTMRETNHGIPDAYVQRGDYSIQSGCQEMEKILLQSEEPPTAVFAANDNMAIGAINCLASRGLRVPQDMSVMGFDDISMAKHFIPALTTVQQDQVAMGIQAVELIIEYKKFKKVRLKKIILEPELVIRESVMKIGAMGGMGR
jgi:DNA-binding LacI/PurR family transcriptional regulator